MTTISVSDAMRKLDQAERNFLVACGWAHRAPYGWVHEVYAKRPLTQWDAVMEARRRVLREVLLHAAGPERG